MATTVLDGATAGRFVGASVQRREDPRLLTGHGRYVDDVVLGGGNAEKLREIPGLHTVEKQALDDSLSALRSLERIEERDGDDERRIAEKALQSLRVIAPRFENLS